MEKKRDKFKFVSIIVTSVCCIIAMIFLFILPDKIAIQWNSNGISSVVDKRFVLVFPILSFAFLKYGKHIINYGIVKSYKPDKDVLGSYASMYIQIVFLTCELYTGLYHFGLRIQISTIFILEFVIGIIIGIYVVCNN